MSKYWSASTTSPGRSLSGNPEFTVKNLSLTLPPQVYEIKVVTPWRHIAIKSLAVFACLYFNHVAAYGMVSLL